MPSPVPTSTNTISNRVKYRTSLYRLMSDPVQSAHIAGHQEYLVALFAHASGGPYPACLGSRVVPTEMGASMSARQALQKKVNSVLQPLGVQLVRGYSADPAIQPWRPARQTITAARRAGVSVGDYLENINAEPGATQKTVDTIISLGGLGPATERICEIGAGSGRYAEKLIAELHPAHYEIYETATDWLPHLQTLPGVEIKPADGHSLAATTSGSVDLVHCDKTFVYLPFPTVVGYLLEMARVVRVGGAIAFDLVTEDCLSDELVAAWGKSGTIFIPLPRGWVVDYLARHGATLEGSTMIPMVGLQTELLVFRRTA